MNEFQRVGADVFTRAKNEIDHTKKFDVAVPKTDPIDDWAPNKETGVEFKFMDDPKQREMLAGRIMTLVEQIKHDGIENMVFLDKSTRPLNTLFIDLWRRSNPDEQRPHISFINIGQETSSKAREVFENYYIKPEEVSSQDVEKLIGATEIARVREQYKYLAEASPDHPVLIVEEYTNSGESLRWACRILQTIFPHLKFKTFSMAYQESRYKKKHDELALFEQWDDPATKQSTHFDPPWRVSSNSPEYGATGVVENEGSLTAKSTTKSITPAEIEANYRKNLATAEKYFKETLPEELKEQIAIINKELER